MKFVHNRFNPFAFVTHLLSKMFAYELLNDSAFMYGSLGIEAFNASRVSNNRGVAVWTELHPCKLPNTIVLDMSLSMGRGVRLRSSIWDWISRISSAKSEASCSSGSGASLAITCSKRAMLTSYSLTAFSTFPMCSLKWVNCCLKLFACNFFFSVMPTIPRENKLWRDKFCLNQNGFR